MTTAYLGMRGTSNVVTDQRPKSWREGLIWVYPKARMALSAITAQMKGQKVDDPEYNWWTKIFPTQAATVTNVYTDSALSSAYVSSGVAGQVVYVKMSGDYIQHFRIGHQVLLRDESNLDVDVTAKVVDVHANGASSFIAAKLLEDDDNDATGTNDLSDCDRALVIGNINAEGAAIPDAISYDPIKMYNLTQIFRTPLEMTRTYRETRLRTPDQYKEAKREALEMHSVEMERSFLWGIRTEGVGDNGKPERTTRGIMDVIKNYAPNNVSNYTSDGSGVWTSGGEAWLDTMMERLFRYGTSDKRMAICGSAALMGFAKLVKAKGDFEFGPNTTAYGIDVRTLVTPVGEIMFTTHPLFNLEPSNRNTALIFEPENLKYRYITDTMFKDDPYSKKGGHTAYDGIKEEFLTECGLEYHDPYGWGILHGIGKDAS